MCERTRKISQSVIFFGSSYTNKVEMQRAGFGAKVAGKSHWYIIIILHQIGHVHAQP